MGCDPVISLIVPLRLFSKILCRNAIEADHLVTDTLKAAIKSQNLQPTDNLKVDLLSLMRKIYFGSLTDDVLKSFEPDDFLECMLQDGASEQASACEHEVEAAIRTLPVHLREALALVMILNQSMDEAATVIGCNAATVSKRVNRARNLLQLKFF